MAGFMRQTSKMPYPCGQPCPTDRAAGDITCPRDHDSGLWQTNVGAVEARLGSASGIQDSETGRHPEQVETIRRLMNKVNSRDLIIRSLPLVGDSVVQFTEPSQVVQRSGCGRQCPLVYTGIGNLAVAQERQLHRRGQLKAWPRIVPEVPC